MPGHARLVRLHHPSLGDAVGALDEHGRWLALIPGPEALPRVEGLLRKSGRAATDSDSETADEARLTLARWFATGDAPETAPDGTPFQRRVWLALRDIPRGETRSYAEIARRVGCRSARAVGGAVGANPVCLFIPCHRVLASDGSLGGFAWGLGLKRTLLRAEGAPPANGP